MCSPALNLQGEWWFPRERWFPRETSKEGGWEERLENNRRVRGGVKAQVWTQEEEFPITFSSFNSWGSFWWVYKTSPAAWSRELFGIGVGQGWHKRWRRGKEGQETIKGVKKEDFSIAISPSELDRSYLGWFFFNTSPATWLGSCLAIQQHQFQQIHTRLKFCQVLIGGRERTRPTTADNFNWWHRESRWFTVWRIGTFGLD